MTGADLVAILPLLVIAGTAVAVLLLTAVRRSHGAVALVTVAGLAGSLLSLLWAAPLAPRSVTPLLAVDPFSLFYWGLLAASSLLVAVLAHGYWRSVEVEREEFYLLLLTATLGAAVLASATQFASFFLGLETLSVSLYGLVAYRRDTAEAAEAGVKYLLLAAASSAFLLLGMALVYAATGSMAVSALAAHHPGGWPGVGLVLVLAGAGFKLAAVPFHLWTPDVYQGAPAPVTAFLATVSKAAMLAALLRVLAPAAPWEPGVFTAVAVLAVASMFTGNLLALLQANLKRLLAYSSIAHMGYMLVAFLAAGRLAVEAVSFYLVAYTVTTLAAFGVISALAQGGSEPQEIEDYRGLLWRRPFLGVVLAGALFSLAGLPLTAGFIGKLYLFTAGIGAALWVAVVLLAVNSAISAYYYLRVIVSLTAPPAEEAVAPLPAMVAGSGIVLVLLGFLLLWMGVLPQAFFALVQPLFRTLL